MVTRLGYHESVPMLIDHARRREELAEAVWRVITRDGVGAVSVRTVAAEAGLSTGSLRHVFPSKEELLVASMELVHRRAEARLAALAPTDGPRRYATRLLAELLPLDDERRIEMDIHIALVAEAAAHAGLRRARDETHAAVRRVCVAALAQLAPGRDPAVAAPRLHAFLDGLAFHLAGRHVPPAEARALLDGYLADL